MSPIWAPLENMGPIWAILDTTYKGRIQGPYWPLNGVGGQIVLTQHSLGLQGGVYFHMTHKRYIAEHILTKKWCCQRKYKENI